MIHKSIKYHQSGIKNEDKEAEGWLWIRPKGPCSNLAAPQGTGTTEPNALNRKGKPDLTTSMQRSWIKGIWDLEAGLGQGSSLHFGLLSSPAGESQSFKLRKIPSRNQE